MALTKKLGRRPGDPTKPRLQLANHLTATLPTAPIVNLSPDLDWPMDHNDIWGDCVVAGMDHLLQVVCHHLGIPRDNWTTEQIVDLYKSQNPKFDPDDYDPANDNGMVIQDFLSFLTKLGLIVGFAAVDPHDEAEVKAAIYLGLGIMIGASLREAQDTQPVWDYDPRSPEWGGHCVVWTGYKGSPDYDTCVTWGRLQDMTQRFVRYQVDEAWFVITKAHLEHPDFRKGFDLPSFAAAYKAITGRQLPVDVTPTPTPAPKPGPQPAPVDPADEALAVAAKGWVATRHSGSNNTMAKQLKAWLAAKKLG